MFLRALQFLRFYFLCFCLFGTISSWSQSQEPSSRAVARRQISPLPSEFTVGNAGLFVGINQFEERSGLKTLRFSVDDAVGVAEFLVIELGLIPTARAYLCISGEPQSEKGRQRLARLKAAGVSVHSAQQNQILDLVQDVCALPQREQDLIYLAFFTHGFERDGVGYVMPSNGRFNFIQNTGINLNLVQQVVQQSKANKRVLMVDACRESIEADTRGAHKMSESLEAALAKTEGMAVLRSCSSGELAWEAPEFGHGVFVHFFLEGLQGKAAQPGEKFVTLGAASAYASREVRSWVKSKKNAAQEPKCDGELARQIPLGISREFELSSADQRKKKGLDQLDAARVEFPQKISGKFKGEIEDHIHGLEPGEELSEWLDQMELLNSKKVSAINNFLRFAAERMAKMPGSNIQPAPSQQQVVHRPESSAGEKVSGTSETTGPTDAFDKFGFDGWPIGVELKTLEAQRKETPFFEHGLKKTEDADLKYTIYYPYMGGLGKYYNSRPTPFTNRGPDPTPGVHGIFVKNGIVKGYVSTHKYFSSSAGKVMDQKCKDEINAVLNSFSEQFGFKPEFLDLTLPGRVGTQGSYTWKKGKKSVMLHYVYDAGSKIPLYSFSGSLFMLVKVLEE